MNVTIINKGIRIGTAHLKSNQKTWHFIPDDSDIDFTIKLGAFPMYVLAP